MRHRRRSADLFDPAPSAARRHSTTAVRDASHTGGDAQKWFPSITSQPASTSSNTRRQRDHAHANRPGAVVYARRYAFLPAPSLNCSLPDPQPRQRHARRAIGGTAGSPSVQAMRFRRSPSTTLPVKRCARVSIWWFRWGPRMVPPAEWCSWRTARPRRRWSHRPRFNVKIGRRGNACVVGRNAGQRTGARAEYVPRASTVWFSRSLPAKAMGIRPAGRQRLAVEGAGLVLRPAAAY